MSALSGYITFDIETTTKELAKRKASPFHPENWVVAVGYSKNGGGVVGLYYGRDTQASHGWLKSVLELERPKILVGFNIKFDIQYMIRGEEDYQAYMAWVADGGQLWDTQLAEYLLDGQRQESHMLSLDEVAPRYGGTLKVDEVKAMWAQGIGTEDIPQRLLMDYLTGRGEGDSRELGDVENTDLIFRGQLEKAKKRGQVRSIQLNNGALLATIEMERNGLFVDVELGYKKAAELRAKADELRAKLHQYLPDDLPFEFNWGSRKQLSALIFGGPVPYKERVHQIDAEGRPAYAQKDEKQYVLLDGSTTIQAPGDHAVIPVSAYVFYASGKQQGQPKTKTVKVNDLTRPKLKWETFDYHFPGMTQPKREWETSEKGVYSTGETVIEELGGRGIPFLDTFSELADIIKDLGTYYIVEEHDAEGEVVKSKGMLSLVHNGMVHTDLSMVSTVTGRFAHSKPNTGNLPRSDTSEVKQMFVSRHGEDGVMMSSDFTSLEVYGQAILSGDEQLIADLRAGLDMHIKRLTQTEKKDYDWLVEQIKKLEVKEWVNKRKNIKVFSFQRQYGAGAPKIARFLKLPVEVIESWIKADEEMYPGVTAWWDEVEQAVRQSRRPLAKFVQHPLLRTTIQLGEGKYRTFDGKVYTFQEYPAPDFAVKRGIVQNFKPTELKNYPVQGLGGEWMKAAMWLAVRAFYRYRNFDGKALLVSTVHDALYADAHKDVKRKAGVLIHACMLAASDLMEWWFGTTIPVPVPSETTWGPSMYEETKFEDPEDFDASAQRVRTWLRTTFMDGYTPSYLQ